MTKPTNPSTDPLVQEFFRLREEVGIPAYVLAEMCGVSNVTLSHWKAGDQGPRLFLFAAALEVLGYELRIVPIEGAKVDYTPAKLGRRAYVERH